MSLQPPSISVVIPTLNEAVRIAATIANVRATLPGAQIVVADGGSHDATAQIARRDGVRVITTKPGRGGQLRAGAEVATGELLLFLHADTLLPRTAARVIAVSFADPRVELGTFRLAFDDGSAFLRASAWLTRFDSVFTRFGDQAIVVRRGFYARLGGFASWPLFEDVDFLRRARRITRVWSFPASVTTSARRFRRHGPMRQQLQNALLLLRYLAGTPPEVLAARYRNAPASVAATPASAQTVASRKA